MGVHPHDRATSGTNLVDKAGVPAGDSRHAGPMSEAELIAAYSAGGSSDHTPQPHELRNAWKAAKQLEELLEVANQPDLRRTARWLRGELFLELMRVEGYFEVEVRDA